MLPAPVKTFSIGFKGDAAYDETQYARLAAERFKTDHTEFHVSPSAIDLIDTLVWHHDGPFGDSSAVPTYLVSKLTREQVTVVLTGDDGDELFAGYLRFYATLIADRIPRPVGRVARGLLSRLHACQRPALAVPNAAFCTLDECADPRASDQMECAVLRRARRAASSRFRRRVEADRQASAHFRDTRDDGRTIDAQPGTPRQLHLIPSGRSAGEDRSLHDGQFRSRLVTVSRSRAYRVCRTLPDDLKLSDVDEGHPGSFADRVPLAINRRGKMGSGVPLDAWFRGELRDHLRDLLLSPTARYRDMLSSAFVDQLVARHLSGTANLGQQLWSIMCFEVWLRRLPDWTRPARSEQGSPSEAPVAPQRAHA
jgi:asparagine synthase (glutamine-hydrolysing)